MKDKVKDKVRGHGGIRVPGMMRAIVYRGPNDLRLETVPVPRIGPRELLVRVAACGVCPTDIKKIQYAVLPPPRIYGHETAGTVAAVGPRVRGFEVGERVALHHHVPCLECHGCRHRAFAQCEQYKRTGITAGFEPAGGGYAEYVRVMPFVLPGVVKIPARNSLLEGAMLEPVNTVLKAVNHLALLPGDTVLVAGQGPIGLMFTRLLALRGIRVVASDLMESRLELAKLFGAYLVQSPKSKGQRPSVYGKASAHGEFKIQGSKFKVQNPRVVEGRSSREGKRRTQHATRRTEIRNPKSEIRNPKPYDAAVIAVASDDAFRLAHAQVRGGGQVLLFSHTRRGEKTPVDLASVCVDEKDLIGSYSADFLLQDEVARLVFSRKLDVRRLITHQFPLEQTSAAVALASNPTADSLKIVVSQITDG
ncbi:MAG: Zn-dependent alcohol dehydrogenase [Verrucomicrobia bacterium]|nr:MAG: Zn-dependent alcohol dehydrogenase [Verrucomicrobiota bacterium]